VTGRGLDVVAPGPATTVQDLGRPGLAHLGVSRSGAADRGALRLANRLVGNPEGAAGLEVTLGGLAVRAAGHLVVAVTGAVAPLTLAGRGAGRNAVLHLAPGDLLTVGTASAGLRLYVAVRGGLDGPAVLGSRSRDTLAGLGPTPLAAGERLPVGRAAVRFPAVDLAPVADPEAGEVLLDAVPGPRASVLHPDVVDRVWVASWRVDPASDRVGVRLAPDPGEPAPARAAGPAAGSVPSEGMVRGAVQVPPSGHPVVFLTDHPVTGGYPVAAVLTDAAADRAAQLRPGQPVRLRRRPVPWI
jgi:biotin-dependent carboxylase-like uncharacterized protein